MDWARREGGPEWAPKPPFLKRSQHMPCVTVECFLRWKVGQAQVSEQLAHEAFHLDQVAQGIWLCRVDVAGIAHLGQELGGDIVAGLDLLGVEGGAEEVFERVDDAVEELEHEQRLDLGRRGDEEKEVGMDEAEDEGGRVGIREVDEVRSWGWVVEEEGQKMCRRQGAPSVCVREDEGAGGESALFRGRYCEAWRSLLVVVENMQGLYDAVHGGVC